MLDYLNLLLVLLFFVIELLELICDCDRRIVDFLLLGATFHDSALELFNLSLVIFFLFSVELGWIVLYSLFLELMKLLNRISDRCDVFHEDLVDIVCFDSHSFSLVDGHIFIKRGIFLRLG